MRDIDRVIKEVKDIEETNLKKMFASYGYDYDYLVSHADEFEILEYYAQDGSNIKTYMHNGEALFTQRTEYKPLEYKYIIEFLRVKTD